MPDGTATFPPTNAQLRKIRLFGGPSISEATQRQCQSDLAHMQVIVAHLNLIRDAARLARIEARCCDTATAFDDLCDALVDCISDLEPTKAKLEEQS